MDPLNGPIAGLVEGDTFFRTHFLGRADDNEYDPTHAGLGFNPAAGASLNIGLEDFDLDALTDEQFEQYLVDREAQEIKTLTQKLTVEQVVESAKKKAAAAVKASPRLKGYGSTKRSLDYNEG